MRRTCFHSSLLLLALTSPAFAQADLARVAESRRIAAIARAAPAVVCIFDEAEMGGGSGVIIDEQGYGLTNFHVVAGMMENRRGLGGLSDGKLYTLEVLGIDPTGDVAMFRLVGKDKFAFAPLGDSDAMRAGDTAIAMGNPFVLSEDYTPTVTRGLVTGVHRYQWGSGNKLVYSDCIQVDTPINPGNSGGPLFNESGEVIGINGRISVGTRGRFNVGFGYAISINQIKRFIPALRAGLLARHGTLQATVDDIDGRGPVFDEVMRDAPASKAGIKVGDRLIRFDDAPIRSRNHFASVLGTYPADWPVPIEFEPAGGEAETGGDARPTRVVTRLEPISPRLEAPFEVDREANLRQVKRVLAGFRKAIYAGKNEAAIGGLKWMIFKDEKATGNGQRATDERFTGETRAGEPSRLRRIYDDGSTGTVFEYDESVARQRLTPDAEPLDLPPEQRMVLSAVHVVHRFLPAPEDQLDLSKVTHAGADVLVGEPAPGGAAERTLLEVIEWPVAEHAVARFAFDVHTGLLRRAIVRDIPSGNEATLDFSDYRDFGGMLWPCTIEVTAKAMEYRERYSDWKVER